MAYRWQISQFEALSNAELYALLRLRQEVFVLEQECLYQDLDNRDQSAVHLFCWEKNELMAYQRALAPGACFADSALGRIVVSVKARGHQVGKALVQRGVQHNLTRWPEHDVRINGQARLEHFYRSLGFAVEGDLFDEDGIPHLHMVYRRLR
ncbi:MAG: GNAT family N-acetyltransferase [Pseudomonadota bacterium]